MSEKVREILESIIREEIAKEFNIPIICPPNNRVEDNICDRFLPQLQSLIAEHYVEKERLPSEKWLEKKIISMVWSDSHFNNQWNAKELAKAISQRLRK